MHFFAAVALSILAGLSLHLQGRARQAEVFSRLEQALHAAEAGIIASQASLEAGGNGRLGLEPDFSAWNDAIAFPQLEEAEKGIALGGFPAAFYGAAASDWAADGRDNNGDGRIDGPDEAGWYAIRAYGRSGMAKRTLEVLFQREDGKLKQVAWREVPHAPANRSSATEPGAHPTE